MFQTPAEAARMRSKTTCMSWDFHLAAATRPGAELVQLSAGRRRGHPGSGGGIIPPKDYDLLHAAGATCVFARDAVTDSPTGAHALENVNRQPWRLAR